MEFEPLDIITQMIESILAQYQESPNLLKYMEVLLEPFQELEEVFSDILNLRLIENAENAQLDVNGELVVLGRGVYDTAALLPFGLDADDVNNPELHAGLGDLNDGTVGGIFRSIASSGAERAYLIDSDYRLTILAKAKKNSYKGGVENLLDVITGIITLGEGETIQVQEDFTTPSDPFVTIIFNKELNARQKSFFVFSKVLPEPAGIRFEYEDINGTF